MDSMFIASPSLFSKLSEKSDRDLMILRRMQHHKKLKNLKLGDFLVESGEDEGDPNMGSNLLTAARTGNAAFLEELLKAKLDPDIGDSKGRTPLVFSENLTRIVNFQPRSVNQNDKLI